MAVDGGCGDNGDWEDRWNHVKKFLERSGPFTHPDFEPGTQVRNGSFKYKYCVTNYCECFCLLLSNER